MPQSPLAATVAVSAGAQKPLTANTKGTLMVSRGGLQSSLNNTVSGVIAPYKTRVGKVIVNAPGSTSGVIAINDAATSGAVAASNLVWQLAYNETANTEGAVFELDFPCQNGIYLTVDGGSPIVSVSFD